MALPDSVVFTRDAWHRLAEHVLSAARYAATGRIGLLPAPGGFATPEFATPEFAAPGSEQQPTVLAVELDEFVVSRAGQQRCTRITTVGQVADFAGITPGAPAQIYQPSTPLEPDAMLRIDRRAAQLLADWYQLGAHALAAFAAEVPGDEPTSAQLWPEHFDLGITAARVNYGVSPGDVHIPEPYLYIGPFDGPPTADDEFWNAPFGAVSRHHQKTSVETAIAFFRHGRDRAHAPRPGPAG
jgi:hypothetical protein